MEIDILTLFPEFFSNFLDTSIIKRAIQAKAVVIRVHNIRSFTNDKYGRVDDYPCGGGAGLVMKCQPILDCLKTVKRDDSHVILLTPRGRTYNQEIAHEFAKKYNHLILICGHYEGIDERIMGSVNEMISIGDYILTGGEIAALAIADSITRLLEGAITETSLEEESFENGLLEYPQYTLPRDFEGKKVPDILFSGNHPVISKWRHKKSLLLTKQHRPDLWGKYNLTKLDKKLLSEIESDENADSWEKEAIEKAAKFMK